MHRNFDLLLYNGESNDKLLKYIYLCFSYDMENPLLTTTVHMIDNVKDCDILYIFNHMYRIEDVTYMLENYNININMELIKLIMKYGFDIFANKKKNI